MANDNSPKGLRRSITALETELHNLLQNAPWKQNNASESPREAAANKNDTASGKPSLAIQIPPSPCNPKKSSKPWYKTLQGWKTLLEVIAIPFAITYAVVTWCQWRDLRNNFEIEQRAWIYFKDLKTNRAVANGVPGVIDGYTFSAILENSGNTPATQAFIYFTSDVVASDMLFDFPIDTKMGYAKLVFGPHASIETSTISLTDQYWAVPPKKTRIFWGWVVYRDIFPKTDIRLTEFCQNLVATMRVGPVGAIFPTPDMPIKGRTETCPVHNCFDKNCEDYDRMKTIYNNMRR
jgi:hypothetical protein